MSETVIFVIRHSEAGDRRAWTLPDPERPLTEEGCRQARALVAGFDRVPLVQLISSPYVRCVQTLGPLAAAHGLPIQIRDELAEGEPTGYVEKIALEAATEGAAALCVHGDGLTGLLRSLADGDVVLEGGGVEERAKGSTWALRVVDGVIASASYRPPLV